MVSAYTDMVKWCNKTLDCNDDDDDDDYYYYYCTLLLKHLLL